MDNNEEKVFFSSRSQGSSSSQRVLSADEKRRHATKILELKKKTKCQKCGKPGHWERECPEHKKDKDSDNTINKTRSKTCDARTSEAHAIISEDFEAGDSSAFMAYVGENQGDDAWYMDGGATDHMTDHLEWFDSLKNMPEGRWPVMITDNPRLWVRGVGRIQVKCQLDGV